MSNITLPLECETLGNYDVIVAGGGLAGAAAALAVARDGKSVLLIEKSQKLGGLGTLGLINLFVPMCNGRGTQIIFGMAEEFFRLSTKYSWDTIPEGWEQGGTYQGPPVENGNYPRYLNRYSPDIFALTLTELLSDAGVELMFDTIVTRPVMEGKHCKGLVVENKSGAGYYEADIVIDVTGDADILYRAGVPCVQGRNFHTFTVKTVTLASCKKAVESGKINDAIGGASGGYANLYGKNHPEGMPFYTGTDAEDVNRYLITNQKELLNNLKKTDRFSREVVTMPGMCQYRTTRHIDGDYTLRESDFYRHFDDSISAICDFDRRDYLMEVPYRTLICSGYDNLITAGRSAAAEGYAWDVLRVIPPAIVTGQAAGLAACQAIDTKCGIHEIDVPTLQAKLASQNVMIHFDDALVPQNGGGETADIGHV